jgi:putative oxidoreductase
LETLVVIGRILIGVAFVVSGVRMIQAFQPVAGLLKAKRVPFPVFVTGAGIAIEIVFGLLAIAGVQLPAVALVLAVFVVAATLMVHRFWEERSPQRDQDINVVVSNAIIVGALLALAGLAAQLQT